MSYTITMDKMAGSVAAQLVAAFDSWQAAKITLAEFTGVAVAYLQAGDAHATALADAALAGFLTAFYRRPVPALGLAVPVLDHEPRVVELVAAAAPRDQWQSYGRSSALARAQDAYGEAMGRHGIEKWTRVLNAGACQLCADLAGEVLPASAPMFHHPGCGCTQKPIIEGN